MDTAITLIILGIVAFFLGRHTVPRRTVNEDRLDDMEKQRETQWQEFDRVDVPDGLSDLVEAANSRARNAAKR